MSECPNIDKRIKPNEFNKPVNYKNLGGNVEYIFYDHDDGFGNIRPVQFCKLCGRKTDVFECLNESEWKSCSFIKASSPPNSFPTGA